MKGRIPNNLVGQRFGRWVVIEYVGNSRWLCHCDCGNEGVVITGNLRSNGSLSCGCLANELTSMRCTTHGKRHIDYGCQRTMNHAGN